MPTEPAAATADPPSPPLPMPSAGSMFRQFIQLLALVACLLLVVRTVFVEPFGVPTGSMAPALLGNHREAACPNCDGPILVSASDPDGGNPAAHVTCPNCGAGPVDLSAVSREILGDRLLVDKSVFTLRSPRRWEVAVFYTPDRTVTRTARPRPFALRAVGSPGEPYVKRVVGLPGEAIHIRDGDVYADGRLCRKSLTQVWQTAIPVMAMAHVPAKTGWSPRWVTEAVAAAPTGGHAARLGVATIDGAELTLTADATPDTAVGLTYRHRNLQTHEDEPVTDRLGYNGGAEPGRPIAVHDFAIRCEVEAVAGGGMFACRLFDGRDAVKVELPVAAADAEPAFPAVVGHDGGSSPAGIPGVQLVPGRKYQLEFAFVDRRATVTLDGKLLAPPLDLPAPPAVRANADVRRPLQFGARGASVVVRDLVLYRDIHYFARSAHAGFDPYTLADDEFFFLGDNANNSGDSREWKDEAGVAKPGVPLGAFIGKPFLIHQPLKAGRVTVNGNDRQFTTVDWDRVRLLE